MLDEEPCKIEVTPLRRQMEQSRPALILGCRVGAMLDKELC
jgi:hypothetical protein